MGHIPLSENTIHRHRPRHDSRGSRAATLLTTLLTLMILVALGALVYHYVTNARPQVSTTAQAHPSHVSVSVSVSAQDLTAHATVAAPTTPWSSPIHRSTENPASSVF